ncbi:MAG: hypothetical protein KBE91_11925 [Bacteroidia bacterium]|nr:hypothetical protein [Bacteroidia bacterium]
MINSSHDTHQIYFERYLRNKMTVGEKQHLEEQLAKNAELKLAFDHYISHRKQLLKELITEHDNGPVKTKLATYFYLVITLIGIAVAFSFYFQNITLKEEISRDKRVIKRLVSYVPFIGKKFANDTADIYMPPINTAEISKPTKKNSPVEKVVAKQLPLVVLDTVLVPLKRNYFDERIDYYLNKIDSNLTQNELYNLIYNNSSNYDIKYKTKPIGVEIIINHEMGNTYRFDGNKLVITSVQLPQNILLVKEEGELIWLKVGNELILTADNQLHNY